MVDFKTTLKSILTLCNIVQYGKLMVRHNGFVVL